MYYCIRKMSNERAKALGMYDLYEVAKFEEGEPVPKNAYDVEIHQRTGKATCNCPAALYQGRQNDQDKHVRMVKDWIAKGCPQPSTVEV